jgi:hypothetical protein
LRPELRIFLALVVAVAVAGYLYFVALAQAAPAASL